MEYIRDMDIEALTAELDRHKSERDRVLNSGGEDGNEVDASHCTTRGPLISKRIDELKRIH
jgi:hypothetical protein|tara:strand:+ start:15187 stop:15369 length:183 start_codon:yes stop_codon:yes gene_type:complete